MLLAKSLSSGKKFKPISYISANIFGIKEMNLTEKFAKIEENVIFEGPGRGVKIV